MIIFLNFDFGSWIDRIGGELLAMIEYCWEHVVGSMKSSKVNPLGDKAQSAYSRSGTALTFSWFKMSEVFPGILILHVNVAKFNLPGYPNYILYWEQNKHSIIQYHLLHYYLHCTGCKGNQHCPLTHHPCYCIMVKSSLYCVYACLNTWNVQK